MADLLKAGLRYHEGVSVESVSVERVWVSVEWVSVESVWVSVE